MAGGFPSGEVAIVGAYESPRRRAPGIHPFDLHAECIRGALADAGLEFDEVDGFCCAAGFRAEAGAAMDICELVEYLGIRPRWFDSTDIGGAAPITHLGHAALAISAGLASTVVVSYAAAGRSAPPASFHTNTHNWGPGRWENPYGLSTIAGYALAAQRHMHAFGTTSEQLAAIAVACRENASHNEQALRRDPISISDVLESDVICSPLHKLDCCVVTDSGGALVLTSKTRADTNVSRRAVYLLGFGEAIGSMHMSQMADFTTTPTRRSGLDAFRSAGLTPSEIDCAQLYDSFTYTVLVTLEDLGFCGRGEGGDFIDSGAIGHEGSLPINTDGGGLSSNHPGRRGALAAIEGVRQLRGESPGLQLSDPRLCLVNGVGGILSSSATLILGC